MKRRGVLVGLVLVLAACSRDAADQAYFQALEGEKKGRSCEELLPLVDRAIALQPARASYWQMRSGYRSGLGDLAGALSDIEQAITLHDRPYLRYSRAIVLCKSGRFSEALADLDQAIAAQPDNLQFYRIRAIARAAAGKGAQALEDGQLVVARMPQWAENFYARGVAWAALGKSRAAVADFTVVLQTRPEIVYPLQARADAYAALGESALAAADRAELLRRSRGHGGCRGCGYCEDPLHQ